MGITGRSVVISSQSGSLASSIHVYCGDRDEIGTNEMEDVAQDLKLVWTNERYCRGI